MNFCYINKLWKECGFSQWPLNLTHTCISDEVYAACQFWPNCGQLLIKIQVTPLFDGTKVPSLVCNVDISTSKLYLSWAVSFPHCREPSFLSPSATAELPPCLGMGQPSTDTALPPLGDSREIPHMHPHTPGHGLRKTAFCLCHLPSQRDKITEYYVKTCGSKAQKQGFSSLCDKQSTGSPRHSQLGSTMPENNTTHSHATHSPSQCVNHCLCWVLHWSTCCQWNSLPWQSFGSIVLLQMVIISSDLVRKWNAFSPLSWLFRQNINEIWKEFIHASGQWIHLPLSSHYKHWQKQDPSN